ncbi:hypothetical protein, partial [Sphingobacterium multivorum]|uniref:hypothetical protein n=1 Tax=Sphingobacterium multivorum TaxID=28454 RepID=UPI0028A60AB7
YTFNVWVLGSNPSGITKEELIAGLALLVLKILGFERRVGRVRSNGGSGVCLGNEGLSQSQRDH